MSTETPPIEWTRQEFLAYLLLYAAQIDVDFSEEEREYILSKVDPQTYERTLQEFNEDNDYDSLQKILAYQKQDDNYSAEQLIQELKAMFLSDEHFHPMEKQMLFLFKRLFEA